ncbi:MULTISPECIES: PTS glucitol/sorbitol transporter subunit IIC [Thermaerobacter]|uniref:PTS glucitol/sorbitol transporter subunit IIC n=1 Tax=Thermaerobacter composti TaxID=554949 RepID=A0ABZ0QM39_9FIRM|nr:MULTISPECIES: PTS glucitol/sorbitol transporter subunit IIC [Thermaerobacter]PZN07894.1 MAG: PTS sorbitol transporter subunit IIC [Bacillota bacterium]QBS36617.1 PTS sorbitol transporter subunit IIC [Thermaerobacter sp. FW80]WPD18550.1 PTS glucitol/sorbitol transporter subunit IIC [Thermaerobacter composti]
MDVLAHGAEWFIGLFRKGGEVFLSLAGGILPTLICLLVAVNALVRIIGQERVERFAQRITRNVVLRYTLLPVLAVFFLTNPMAYTFGRFLQERHKPAFYDAAVSFVHPVTGLFPHANPAELFVWLGIAQGVEQLGLPLGPLALRYFLVGVVVIFLRGVVTELITNQLLARRQNVRTSP